MTGVDEVSGVAYYGAVAGFTKLFSTIVDSTVWREEMHVKVVWITMLAKANRNGDVLASVPGLADAARVSLDQCVEALARLSAPDTWSRTKEHEGRRIVEVDGGWRLLNYPKYRELRDADERRIQTREAVRRYRAKEKANPITVSTSKHGKPRKAQAEAEAEAEADQDRTDRHKKRLAFGGHCLQLTPRQHELFVRMCNAQPMDLLGEVYPRWDRELQTSGQPFDVLPWCIGKLKGELRIVEPRASPAPAPAVDPPKPWVCTLHEPPCAEPEGHCRMMEREHGGTWVFDEARQQCRKVHLTQEQTA